MSKTVTKESAKKALRAAFHCEVMQWAQKLADLKAEIDAAAGGADQVAANHEASEEPTGPSDDPRF